ncbi:MAG: iron-sulfur cluster assembly scaffold protein [Candidatus Woesearchaeota archaeon]
MLKYSKETMKRFTEPRFAGEMDDANAVGEEGNLKCGDMMRIYLKVEDGVIKDIRFLTYGCVAAIASTDALCEIVKGKTLEEAKKMTWKDVVDNLGEVPPIKYHCSIMGIEALQDAIKNYEDKEKGIAKDSKKQKRPCCYQECCGKTV